MEKYNTNFGTMIITSCTYTEDGIQKTKSGHFDKADDWARLIDFCETRNIKYACYDYIAKGYEMSDLIVPDLKFVVHLGDAWDTPFTIYRELPEKYTKRFEKGYKPTVWVAR